LLRDAAVVRSEGGATDRAGVLAIDRDLFLNPSTRAPDLVFHTNPLTMPSVRSPWLTAMVKVPSSLDEITRVEFTACAVELRISSAFAIPAGVG
jgi:hypothetical protein